MSVYAVPMQLGKPERGGVIEDIEALVNKVISDRVKRWPRGRQSLNDDQRESLITHLVETAWELERRYDPKKDKNPNFPAFVAHILNLRIVDWFRQEFVDTRHGEKPVVLSLDAPLTLDGGGGYEDAAGAPADRLVDTLAASTGDPAEDRSPDLVGLLNGGSGRGPRAHDQVGQPPARGAARGDRGTVVHAGPVGGSGRRGSRKRAPARVMPRNATPLPRRSAKPPVCGHCFDAFFRTFTKVNSKVAAGERLTAEAVEAKAAKRAQAVRFGSEWACPRCTKLETPEGHELMLQQAYPNRRIRRAAVGGANSRKLKPSPKRAKRQAL